MHEIKLKERSRDKLDAILTGITSAENKTDQAINIASWKCAARVFVSTDGKFDLGHIETQQPETDCNPTLREVFGQFMMVTPGNKVIAICDPDSILSENVEDLFKQVDSSGMQMAWGAYAGIPWPKLFIMNASIVPYFFRNIPDIRFSDPAWKVWMDTWLKHNLQPHRYFNGNPYGIVREAIPSPVEPLSPVVNAYDRPINKKVIKRAKSKK